MCFGVYKNGTQNQGADVFFIFLFSSLRASYGKSGQVWWKLGQKWCLKCTDLKNCTQHEMKRFFVG